MGGFLFRLGVRLKDTGERWKWDWLIRHGLCIKEFIFGRGVFENGKIKIE